MRTDSKISAKNVSTLPIEIPVLSLEVFYLIDQNSFDKEMIMRPEPKWNHEMLDAMREMGDPPADQLVHDIFEKHEEQPVNQAFVDLVRNDQTVAIAAK